MVRGIDTPPSRSAPPGTDAPAQLAADGPTATGDGPRRLRVAVVELAPWGGLLHYAVQLGDGLAASGHDVDLLLAAGHELQGRPGPARRLEVLPRGAEQTEGPLSRMSLLRRRARTAAYLAQSWRSIIGAVRRARYDAVLLNGSLDLTFSVAAVRLLMRTCPDTAIAHVCHNVRPFNRWSGDELFASSPRLERALRDLYPRFDVVFVHGERSRGEFDEHWPGARLAVVPHGDERVFGDDPPAQATEPRALFFGDWRRVKGLDVLMAAFDAVADRVPDARLTIAGSPAPEEGGAAAVLAWAAERPGSVEVRPGYVPLDEVRELFGTARVVVLPYRVGYQSGVLHVAMTMARAVVVTDVGDLPSAVEDGVGGFVVPPADPDALADAVGRVLADPALAHRLGTAGHARVLAGSSWATVATEVATRLAAAARAR